MFRTLAPYLAYSYLTFVKWTTRWRVHGGEHRLRLRRAGRRFIYAFWHNKQVFFTFSHRGDGLSVLVSRSRDGDIIAKVMDLSRIEASRGSSSRGATAGVRDMMATLARGTDLGITPDGPKGPARRVKTGVLFLSRKFNIPILPSTNATSRCLTLRKTWDRYQIPLPFARAVVRYGAPISVAPDDDLEAKAEELRLSLDRITDAAEREVGPAGRWPLPARLLLWLEDLLCPLAGLAIVLRFALSPRRRVLMGLAEELPERFGRVSAKDLAKLAGRPVLWAHAASAGEVAAVEGLIQKVRGSCAVVMTCTTRAGRDQARKSPAVDCAVLAPLDAGPIVGRFLSAVQPRALLLAETELWPAMIAGASAAGLKICLVNGRLSDRTFGFYRRLLPLVSPFLARLDAVSAQTQRDAERFAALGAPLERVDVCGNMKFDRLAQAGLGPAAAFLREMGWDQAVLFVAGSTHPVEEDIVLEAFGAAKKDFPALKLVLAPRHVERAAALKGYSRWSAGPEPGKDILIVDALGLLPEFYRHAAFAFVGGTLVPVGGHNLAEPAIAGVPVLFGPHVFHQRQAAQALLDGGCGWTVSDASELAQAARRFCADPLRTQELGRLAAETARGLQGATQRTAAHIGRILEAA